MQQVGPTPQHSRIETLDVIRGIAICGILPFNIPLMGFIGLRERPEYPAVWNLDWSLWGLLDLTLAGSMRGLFTMLFGGGMLLMLRRAEGEQAQVAPIDVWTRRCLGLGLLGVVNFVVLLWPGEILWNYGLTGLVLLAFRTARPRHLIIASLTCLFVLMTADVLKSAHHVRSVQDGTAALAAQAAHKPLSAGQDKALKTVVKLRESMHPPASETAKERSERTHWPSVVGWSCGLWSTFYLTQTGWSLMLESLSFMLMGMALFRMGVLTGRAPSKVYAGLIVFGYAGGFCLRGVDLWTGARIGFDPSALGGPPWLVTLNYADFELARLLVTLGHVGLITLLFRHGLLGRATPLRALGRMALTTYMAQSLITSVLFYGLGLLGRFSYAGLMGLCVCIWVATGVFCWAWLRRFEQGPVEALLRLAAYDSFRPGWARRRAAAVLASTPSI